MILYLDSSALVKLYVGEEGTDRVRALVLAADTCAASAIAYAEIRAAIARRNREGSLTASELLNVKSALLADWYTLFVISAIEAVVTSAGDLAEQYALRGMDAIHLSSALWLAREQHDQVTFTAWDTRLVAAAAQAGLEVAGP